MINQSCQAGHTNTSNSENKLLQVHPEEKQVILLPRWLPKRGGELGLFAELDFNLRLNFSYLSAWCFYNVQ